MRVLLIFAACGLLAACSSTTSRPTSEPTGAGPEVKPTQGGSNGGSGGGKKSAPDVKGEVGALDAGAVKKNFGSLAQKAERCQDDRRKQSEKLDFLAGEFKIEVRVNEDGSVKSASLSRSTIGDRVVEKCIVDAARAMTWPRPEGGMMGIAGNEITLPMKGDREAVPWGADKASSTLSKAQGALGACKSGAKGGHEVTIYVDTDGKVIAAGASQGDPEKASTADCIADAVKGLKFPSPGGWPAKVTAPVP